MKTPAIASLATAAVLTLLAACQTEAPEPEPEAARPDPEEEAVVAAVLQLFEAMRTADGEMARAVFHPDARLGRADDDGITFRPADGFIDMIGQPRDVVYDEPIWDWVVQIDGRLAHMWTKYAFYLGDEFSHCGEESFQLYKADTGWQITQLIDTSRRENCFYPPGREPAEETGEPEPES
ncbi:MAG: nuclear transport factor 2 family protein [Gemmatimonadetes bacterium]|nr:nuclear transport factor 2 family protein [Gemmatimonadota bacterium]MYB97874.1 nuclear transport factor 2 family protein [Gemmatimonadota bacterium]MYH54277.1 nuclear transport factor 2 family protein [Gemmatimonadota bacterium]MYK65099.1 nuclear transport factor 2 family protein [Gemmatimonadota bacterium]